MSGGVRAMVTEVIDAPAEQVFALLHDYRRRLEWDPMLSQAYLEPGFERADCGAISVCRGTLRTLRIALRTQYVSFKPGVVAAVKMLNRPAFFAHWAASIRHRAVGEHRSEIVYTYSFKARPALLRWLLEPVMNAVFQWETKQRLRALKAHFALR